MIGVGIYVLMGIVVKDFVGLLVILLYVFVVFVVILVVLCYVEFGVCVFKVGFVYLYIYVMLGEIWGFIIGWNILLEYFLGVLLVVRVWSGGLDFIFNGVIKNLMFINIGYLSYNNVWILDYLDFVVFVVILMVFFVVVMGVKFVMNFNNFFIVINLIVIVIIIVFGFYFVDVKNWIDNGGFFLYGFGGMWVGVVMCFYVYIGFEGVVIVSEEVKNFEKFVLIVIILFLGIVIVLYVLVICVLILMVFYIDVNLIVVFLFVFV